jgi:hypothetical protein
VLRGENRKNIKKSRALRERTRGQDSVWTWAELSIKLFRRGRVPASSEGVSGVQDSTMQQGLRVLLMKAGRREALREGKSSIGKSSFVV